MVLIQESVDSLAQVSACIVRDAFFFSGTSVYQVKIVAQRKRKFRSCMIVHHCYCIEVRGGNRGGNGIKQGHSGRKTDVGKTGENDNVMKVGAYICLYHCRRPYQIHPRKMYVFSVSPASHCYGYYAR